MVNCADCGLEFDLPQGEPCPDCGSTNRHVTVQATAAGALGFAGIAEWEITLGQKTWEDGWRTVIDLYNQIQGFYSRPSNNLDAKQVLDHFFIACWHISDALRKDHASLPTFDKARVWAYYGSSTALKVANAYTNTLKHFEVHQGKAKAEVLSYRGTNNGLSIKIRYEAPNGTVGDLDALQLATDCVTEWRTFFAQQGITPPM